MSDTTREPGQEAGQWIDRLVSGDLDEAERRRLLAWLEAEPARWRRCGLAFLEAQTWSQALAHWPPARPAPAHDPSSESRTRRPARAVLPGTILLASLCVAFGLGLVAGRLLQPDHSSFAAGLAESDSSNDQGNQAHERGASPPGAQQPVLASLDVEPFGPGPATAVHIPLVPGAADVAAADRRSDEIPESLRRQWERRGYRLESQRRYLFATLPDGEQVAVPVQQIHMTPIPTKVY